MSFGRVENGPFDPFYAAVEVVVQEVEPIKLSPSKGGIIQSGNFCSPPLFGPEAKISIPTADIDNGAVFEINLIEEVLFF